MFGRRAFDVTYSYLSCFDNWKLWNCALVGCNCHRLKPGLKHSETGKQSSDCSIRNPCAYDKLRLGLAKHTRSSMRQVTGKFRLAASSIQNLLPLNPSSRIGGRIQGVTHPVRTPYSLPTRSREPLMRQPVTLLRLGNRHSPLG